MSERGHAHCVGRERAAGVGDVHRIGKQSGGLAVMHVRSGMENPPLPVFHLFGPLALLLREVRAEAATRPRGQCDVQTASIAFVVPLFERVPPPR